MNKNLKLVADIKADTKFLRNAKIICFAIIVFFLCDAVLNIFLSRGLEKYYGLNSSAEIALVGHSHLMLGIDKSMLEQGIDKSIAKFTREGVNINDRKIMVKQLLRHNTKLKTIIYGVDAWSFTGEGLSANSYKLFYPFLEDNDVDAYVKKQSDISDYWVHKLIKTTRFNEGLINSSIRGYLQNWSNLKIGVLDTVQLKKEIALGRFRKIDNSIENVTILRETLAELKSHNIEVILLYIPTIDFINTAERIKFKETLQILENLDREFNNVKFVSLLEPWSHDYSLFFDQIHMNPKGQKLMTQELIKIMNQKK